ncbi:hypothetical protein K1719_010864 [Acacia pycnantha]|nr:hypothetical protein K1719_010864 [Acacia pycnantha]
MPSAKWTGHHRRIPSLNSSRGSPYPDPTLNGIAASNATYTSHADALSKMKSLEDQIVADPIFELSDDEDEDSVGQIIYTYTASFQELVSRPSFIPFWGIVTIEKHTPLALVIDIIIEQVGGITRWFIA